jgi:putative tryptophan/tyrosine transport system substrate-binding protein
MISRRRFIAGATSSVSISSFAGAQQIARKPRIGVLWHAANIEEETPFYQALNEGFRQLGYVNGVNIVIEHRFADEKPELFTSLTVELAAFAPDVLVAVGAAAPYVKKATGTIPIVFMYVPDPVGADLVESVRRPGGNATGLTNFSVELSAKRLQYLKEISPSLSRVALLINPHAKISELYVSQSNEAAPKLGMVVQPFVVRTPDELEPAFEAMAKADIQGVVVNAESLFYKVKDRLVRSAIARRLPTCVWTKEVTEAGALFSYGTDQQAIARKVALYVDRILKGEKPSDMPVDQPATFEFVINLKTANALGLTVPQALLLQANEVIE